jgi:hypothetical protein
MSVKKSVMLSDSTVKIMESMTDKRNPDNSVAWSNQINRAIVVLDFLARTHLPDFTDQEWQTILNCYAGTCGSLERPPYRVASDLMDDLGLIDVEAHPDSELVKRIHGMSQVEQFSILVFVEKFWSHDWNHCKDFGEIKKALS